MRLVIFLQSVVLTCAAVHERAPPSKPDCTASGVCLQLVWQPNWTQVNSTSFPGNKGGIEDGIVVRRADGGFSMIGAEMYGDPHWVAMRLGVYTSTDALHWEKSRTLRTSKGKFSGEMHDATWGPFFLRNPVNDTWAISYVGYRCAANNASGWLDNFDGTIFMRYATAKGDAGLDSAFGEDGGQGDAFAGDTKVIGPDDFNVDGPWPHPCQGLQGTDSFYPYQLNDGSWAALAGTSMQQRGWKPGQGGNGKWPVSLATAPTLDGPWTRYNPTNKSHPADAPCVDINGGGTENPIIQRRPDNEKGFQMVYDDLHGEGRGFGYAVSDDGINWAKGINVAVPGGTRTPFGLVPMTNAEKLRHSHDLLDYGILNATTIDKKNSSLQWLFYTVGGWEAFRTAVVQVSW